MGFANPLKTFEAAEAAPRRKNGRAAASGVICVVVVLWLRAVGTRCDPSRHEERPDDDRDDDGDHDYDVGDDRQAGGGEDSRHS
jgi:hypothetical protein